jgi:uncharacterized protein YbbK (DUF523 family)
MKLVSSCLLGINCAWDGKNNYSQKVMDIYKTEVLIPVCPEQLGGLTTPRKPCGIYGPLAGQDSAIMSANYGSTKGGEDFTESFRKGADEVLALAKGLNIAEAILKQGSPSCGCGRTWQLDDKFENHKVEGDGILASLLKKNGINVITEEDL